MKKRVYSDPSMEIVILNGEDIICASNTDADNNAPSPFSNNSTNGNICHRQSITYLRSGVAT